MIALHPFGDPQTVRIAPDPDDPSVVTVTWQVGAADDLTLLGIHLGVLPEDRVLLDGAVMLEPGDAEAVSAAPEVGEYLLEHISVPGCDGELTGAGNLIDEGAELTFTCPDPVASADVEITTLTDLHPAYKTLGTGPDGQRAAYDLDNSSHTWQLGTGGEIAGATAAARTSGSDAALQIGAVLAGVLAVLALLVLARRLLPGRTSTAYPTGGGSTGTGPTQPHALEPSSEPHALEPHTLEPGSTRVQPTP